MDWCFFSVNIHTGKHGANMSHQCHPTPQDAAVPMLRRLGLLGVESLPDLLGEEGKGMELKGTRTALYIYICFIYIKS